MISKKTTALLDMEFKLQKVPRESLARAMADFCLTNLAEHKESLKKVQDNVLTAQVTKKDIEFMDLKVQVLADAAVVIESVEDAITTASATVPKSKSSGSQASSSQAPSQVG